MGDGGVAVGYRPYRLAVRPVDILIVDDRDVCAGCEGFAKARQNKAGIHPMEAGATCDQPIGRIERRIFCSTRNPPDASVGAGGKIATFGDHRGRWFDRVDPLGERGHIAGKSSGSRTSIENRSRRDEAAFQHLEHSIGIWRTTAIRVSDGVVSEDVAQAHSMASRRAQALLPGADTRRQSRSQPSAHHRLDGAALRRCSAVLDWATSQRLTMSLAKNELR